MAICVVDGDGWCERHQRKHIGSLLRMALDPSPLGERYRERMDAVYRRERSKNVHHRPVVRGGPGTELKSMLREMGIAPKGCGCDDRARQMDSWGVAGCRANLPTILNWLQEQQEKQGWLTILSAAAKAMVAGIAFNPLDPLPGIVQEAIRRAEEKGRRAMLWVYGVTTVPERRHDLLPRTLASLTAGGFPSPRLFVDGCDGVAAQSYVEQFGLEVTARFPRIRTHGNWLLAFAELYLRQPEADRYAIFQDDVVVSKDLRQYLERVPYPDKSYLNLYTFMENEHIVKDKPVGFHEASIIPGDKDNLQHGRGALALVFDFFAGFNLLARPEMFDRAMDVGTGIDKLGRKKKDRGWRKVDGGVVNAMNRGGFREYIHHPSLVQHIGEKSSMGNAQKRPANTFRGEDFSCLSLLG